MLKTLLSCSMNRLMRLVASLRRPTLRCLASYCLSSCSSTEKPLSVSKGYGSLLVTVGLAAAVTIAAFSWLGGSGFLKLWLMAEGLFVVFNAIRCWHLNSQATHIEVDLYKIRSHFEQFLRSIAHLDAVEHLKDWFMEEAFVSMPRENVRDLVAYAFGFRKRDKKPDQDMEFEVLLEDMLRTFENRMEQPIRDGFRPHVRFRSHLWENLRVRHYPLALYCIMEALDMLFACLMALLGFLTSSFRGQRYYYIKPSSSSSSCIRLPVLFIHGLGIGPIIYSPFIWLLCQLGHPIIVIQMRHLSVRLCFSSPSVDSVVSDIEGILKRHEIDQCIVVGHSYGTFIASRLNCLHPDRVAGMCMMDPVCCVMHNPKLLRTFVYGDLQWNTIQNCIDSAIMWFFSREPCIAASVCRNFRWTEFNLWPEDIPSKTILVLSEADRLVPVEDVKRVFGKTHARLVVHPSHSHGSFLSDLQWQSAIIQHIQECFSQT